MRKLCLYVFIIFTFIACTNKSQNINFEEKKSLYTKTLILSKKIEALSNNISKEEAKEVSKEAIVYSKYLANKYEIIKPAIFHNTLVNLQLKEKGYCYHYANDLLKHLQEKNFQSFYFIKAVANKGEYFEHTSLVLTRDDISFENSIVFDAWRNAGELYFSTVKDDKKYEWKKR